MNAVNDVLITSLDPNSMARADVMTVHSIVDVNLSGITKRINFTERETEKAMLMAGVSPDDLVKMSAYDRGRVPGTPGIKQRIISDLENRRIDCYNRVVEARNQIIQENARKKPYKRPAVTLKEAPKYDKLKAKRLAGYMLTNERKKQVEEKNNEAEIRVNARQQEMQARSIANREADVNRLREKLARVKCETEAAPKDPKILRERQREKERDAIAQLEKELKVVPKRDKARLEAKRKELQDVIDAAASAEAKFQEKMLAVKELPRPRVHETVQQQGIMEQIRLIREVQAEREKMANKRVEQTIREREERVLENQRVLAGEKRRRILAIRLQRKRRSRSAMEAVEILAAQKRHKFEMNRQRQEESKERVAERRAEKEAELQERAGEGWLRLRKGADNAKCIDLKHRFDALTKVEKTIERQELIARDRLECRNIMIRDLRRSEIAKLKARNEFDELEQRLLEDPDADPIQLAKNFHISMASVRRMKMSMGGL